MDKNQLKKELAHLGYDFSMLAQALGRSPSLISKVAGRQAKSRLVAEAFAKLLDRPVAEIFPDVPEYCTDVPTTRASREARAEQMKRILEK
ncbi:hypothetical protein [Aliidiomarina indica]|uniref:hypothetical protein n=1 Tax=Aliidiomarina indica TaxID=2749147 RepID=UPI0018909286|nr:hypothetical protein [Aliidiomarina indica]